MIHLIRNDEKIMLFRQLYQSVAPFLGKRCSVWVVKGRDQIKEFRTVFSQFRLQCSEVEPIFVHIDGNYVQAVVGKDLKSEKIGRLLHKDGVTCLGEERTDQI